MGEFAVFTQAIAEELIARGFKLRGYTGRAWFFDDSVSLQRTVSELVEAIEGSNK